MDGKFGVPVTDGRAGRLDKLDCEIGNKDAAAAVLLRKRRRASNKHMRRQDIAEERLVLALNCSESSMVVGSDAKRARASAD